MGFFHHWPPAATRWIGMARRSPPRFYVVGGVSAVVRDDRIDPKNIEARPAEPAQIWPLSLRDECLHRLRMRVRWRWPVNKLQHRRRTPRGTRKSAALRR